MAQYFDNFNDDTVDLFPADWTSRWESMAVADCYVRASSVLGTNWETLAGSAEYTPADTSVESEIVVLARSSDPTNSNAICYPILCGSGTTSATRSGYFLFIRPGSTNYQIRRVSSGSVTTLASATLPAGYYDSGAGNSFYARLQVTPSGSNVIVRGRVWSTADTEPGTWDLSHEDTSPLSAGWQGVGSATSTDPTFFGYGWVGIGTAGSAAPTEPVTATIPTLSAPGVTEIGSTSVRPQITLTF